MSFFKDKNNKVYNFNEIQIKQGLSDDYTEITEDEADELRESENTLTGNDLIYSQIEELEITITERRKREALLGDEDAITFITDVNSQIEELRSQLT